jgi:predicted methyltransferase
MTAQASTLRRVGLVVGSIAIIFATGMMAGRMLESYDFNIGFQREAARIAEVLQVREGMIVADIRAGQGRWTVDLARRVGDSGHIYSTPGPVSPPHVLIQTVADSGVNNVTIISRMPGDTGRLPEGCCDSILLRHVYRGFEDRPALAGQLLTNLRPGGRLAVIDRIDSTSPGMPTNLISPRQVIEELSGAGFEVVDVIENWGPNAYCLVFRRPDRSTT